jgi:hypothetical protein
VRLPKKRLDAREINWDNDAPASGSQELPGSGSTPLVGPNSPRSQIRAPRQDAEPDAPAPDKPAPKPKLNDEKKTKRGADKLGTRATNLRERPVKSALQQGDAPQIRSTEVVRVPILDQAALSQQRIGAVRVLKGNADKSVGLVAIGAESYVIKGGNDLLQDHLINTDLLRALKHEHLKVPQCEQMTQALKQALIGELLKEDSTPKQDLAKALAKGASIATVARGFEVSSISEHTAEQRLYDSIRGTVDSESAIDVLLSGLKPNNSAKTALIAAARVPATRAETLVKMEGSFVSSEQQKALKLIREILDSGLKVALRDRQRELTALDDARTSMYKFARTEGGAHALATMCTVDLLTGMYDRVVGAWNGGNFMFDAEADALWCVDNAKSAYGLSDVQSPGLAVDKDKAWQEYFIKSMLTENEHDGSLSERIHYIIYDRPSPNNDVTDFAHLLKLNLAQRHKTKEGVDAAVEDTLRTLESMVQAQDSPLDPHVRTQLAGRLALLRARDAYVKRCMFDFDFIQPPKVWTHGRMIEKLRRKGDREPIEVFAKELKRRARTEALDDDALAQLEGALLDAERVAVEAAAQVSGGPAYVRDRRVDKALFELRFARLLSYLKSTNQGLQDQLAGPYHPWTTGLGAILDKAATEGTKRWLGKLTRLEDKAGIAKLERALDVLHKTGVQLETAAMVVRKA